MELNAKMPKVLVFNRRDKRNGMRDWRVRKKSKREKDWRVNELLLSNLDVLDGLS